MRFIVSKSRHSTLVTVKNHLIIFFPSETNNDAVSIAHETGSVVPHFNYLHSSCLYLIRHLIHMRAL